MKQLVKDPNLNKSITKIGSKASNSFVLAISNFVGKKRKIWQSNMRASWVKLLNFQELQYNKYPHSVFVLRALFIKSRSEVVWKIPSGSSHLKSLKGWYYDDLLYHKQTVWKMCVKITAHNCQMMNLMYHLVI